MENNYTVEFLKKLRLFKVRLFDDVSELTVKACFATYEKLVEMNFDGKPFKLMINNSGYRPATESAHRLIRQLFTNQTYKENCVRVAIVNENIPTINKRKESAVIEVEAFFSNEAEAVEWIEKEN
jgi:hypothetical protein